MGPRCLLLHVRPLRRTKVSPRSLPTAGSPRPPPLVSVTTSALRRLAAPPTETSLGHRGPRPPTLRRLLPRARNHLRSDDSGLRNNSDTRARGRPRPPGGGGSRKVSNFNSSQSPETWWCHTAAVDEAAAAQSPLSPAASACRSYSRRHGASESASRRYALPALRSRRRPPASLRTDDLLRLGPPRPRAPGGAGRGSGRPAGARSAAARSHSVPYSTTLDFLPAAQSAGGPGRGRRGSHRQRCTESSDASSRRSRGRGRAAGDRGLVCDARYHLSHLIGLCYLAHRRRPARRPRRPPDSAGPRSPRCRGPSPGTPARTQGPRHRGRGPNTRRTRLSSSHDDGSGARRAAKNANANCRLYFL